MKVKGIDIIICLLYYAIFKIYAMPVTLQQITKVIAIVIVFCFLISSLNLKKMLNISLPFSFSVCMSSGYAYMRSMCTFEGLFNGILYGIILYCLCTLLIFCRDRDYIDRFINCFYKMSLLYVLFSFFSIIMNRSESENTLVIYFVGNKFTTSYLFIVFTVLFGIKYIDFQKNVMMYQIMYFLLSIGTICISWYIHCTTSVIASLVLIIMPLVPKTARKFICNVKGILVAASVATVAVFMMALILQNQQIRHFIVNVLKESLTLTGRLPIYNSLPNIIAKSPVLGYGYGNNIVSHVIGYGNAQNGELEILLDYGIIGGVSFLWTIYICTCTHVKENCWRMYILVYAMLLASIVEISLGYIFFFSIYAIYAMQQPVKKKKKLWKAGKFCYKKDKRMEYGLWKI